MPRCEITCRTSSRRSRIAAAAAFTALASGPSRECRRSSVSCAVIQVRKSAWSAKSTWSAGRSSSSQSQRCAGSGTSSAISCSIASLPQVCAGYSVRSRASRSGSPSASSAW